MKKLTFLTLILCSFVVANAEQISRNQAAAIAGKYLPSINSETAQPMKKAVGVNQSAPEYYVFNAEDGKGFVIVSGDDELTEVVGYSTTGTFKVSDDMPVGLSNYLSRYSNYVKAVRAGEAAPIKKAISMKATPVVAPLVTTKWDQGTPYNMFAPYDRNVKGNCPIGCVATAFAQIMNYHEWPENGAGSRSYSSDYGTHSVNFNNSKYDWANMLDEYNRYQEPNGNIVNEYTDAQARAVGKLMWDCAVSVGMQFSPDGSGALEPSVLYACANYFYYDTEVLYRNGTIKGQFLEKVKACLDESKPLMFCGDGTAGGHAYVADGYDSNGFLSINWGWSGISDGYYNIDLMNPDDLGTGGGASGFVDHQVIIALTPNKTGNMGVEGQMPLVLLDEDYGESGYFNTDATSFKKGETFKVFASRLWNFASSTKSYDVTVGIFDSEGNRVALSPTVYKRIRNMGSQMLDPNKLQFDLTEEAKNLSDGSYYVKLLCKEIRSGMDYDWIYVVTPNYVKITVSGDNVVSGDSREIEMVSAITSDSPEYLIGETAKFSVKLSNKADVPAMGTVKFLLSDAETGAKKKTFSETLSLSASSTADFDFDLNITSSPFTVGKKYKVSFYSYTSVKGDHKFVSVDDSKSCVFSVVDEKGGVSQLEASSVSVYPNPASDYVKVNADAEIVSIELYNAGGSLVKKVAGADEISVSDCPAGYYLVNVVTEKGSIRKSVIVK